MYAQRILNAVSLLIVGVAIGGCPTAQEVGERDAEKMMAAEVKKWEGAEAVNLGPVVNSPSRETGVAVTADGRTLYFVSDRPRGVGGRDIWVTTLTDDRWTPPVNLGRTVNSVADDGGLTISADGKRLIFASNRPGGFGGEDLYMTTLVDGKWAASVNLGLGVNTRYNEAMAYMTKDDRELYFHSDRPGGGPGDRSIWTSKFQDGRWQPAVSLGPEINSKTASNAYLSNDGLTLLFSSGIARVNERILVASRARVTDLKWTKPVYLGPRINVDGSFFSSCPEVTADGKSLFFISNRPGGVGDGDIWMARIK